MLSIMLSERTVMQADADDLGSLILEVFRLNGRLLTAGDRLVRTIGLTSARWQILGSVARADQTQTVAQIAREAGVSRQGVQRIVDELVAEQLLKMLENQHDKRAKLVGMSSKGLHLYREADKARRIWLADAVQGLTRSEIDDAKRILFKVRERLELSK